MDAIRTDNYGGASQLFDAMDTTIDMIEAFETMLAYTLRSGEDVRKWGYGMTRMLNQQCEDLRFIYGALREQFDALRDAKIQPDRNAVHG